MMKLISKLLILIIALALPFLLVVSSIRLLANDWFINFEYSRPDFPPDVYGFTLAQRTPLALTGLHSVLPDSDGIGLLEQAKLPDGSPAFNAREIKHMTDVRNLIAEVYPLQLLGLSLMVILALLLRFSADLRKTIPLGLRWGAALTLVILAGLIAYIFINFDAFFLQFHQLFFEGTSFAFAYTDTLIRLYPEQFWNDAAITIGVITAVFAILLLIISQIWLKRIDRAASTATGPAARPDDATHP
jgi:integral membrane protein (TIGR01906 family)